MIKELSREDERDIYGYESCEDRELVKMAQEGDLQAEEALMRRYKGTVKKRAHYYYMAGADEDDIVQEGMIGLLKAIRQYDVGKEASFSTFAGICIMRQIINAIRTADREKHKALNTSVSLSRPMSAENGDNMVLADTLIAGSVENPEALLVIQEVVDYIIHNVGNIFSDFEMQVLSEALKGNDYDKISLKLGKNRKSVDNAMQRVKKKIVEYLWA